MRPNKFLLSVLLLVSFCHFGQIVSPNLKRKIDSARVFKQPIKIAAQFLGLPYIENALSRQNPEQLITDLSGFDCVTLFDNVYALYTSKGQDTSYLNQLIKVRYFEPKRVLYENRNHYFSSTIEKLLAEGQLEAVRQPGGELTVKKSLNVLSESLKNKSLQINLDALKMMEQRFSSNAFTFIPTKQIPKILPKLREGDLVLFVTKHEHMDFHHVGFLVKKGARWHILHASQHYKKVIVSPEHLMEYMQKHPSFPGIQVYHLNLP